MLHNSFPAKGFVAGVLFSTALVLSACSNSVAGKRVDSAARDERVQVHAIPVKLKELRRNVESVGSLFPLEEVTVSSEVCTPIRERRKKPVARSGGPAMSTGR